MPVSIEKISPIDNQPSKAVGISLPFNGQAVFNSTYQTKDAIKTNIINYFLTARGERYLNPLFGNKLQNLLFDQLTQDKIREIDAIVRNDLKIYFPRVEPVEINTIGTPDNNTVQFTLQYKVRDTNIEDEVVINFEQ
jgi:phage baseplate assembly protein W|tara:strand:- start:2133 stop:2543 length:411 start_codon:yes stop_codon:yes gene_type:complete